MPLPETSDTRDSLFRAAEKLFAQHGVDGASLRAITREAGANLASVNYHFGSKEELVRAVFARRLAPLNARRLELLGDFEKRAVPGSPVELEKVLYAFLGPVIHMSLDAGRDGSDFARLMSRTLSSPKERLRSVVLGEMAEVKHRFLAAFQQVLPELPREEVFWRLHFTAGAGVHTAGAGHLLEMVSDGLCDASDVEKVIERLVTFTAAGFRSSGPEAGEGGE